MSANPYIGRSDSDLVALFGVCHLCGAPACSYMLRHSETNVWTGLFCTREPVEHYYDVYGLTAKDKKLLNLVFAERRAVIEGRA